MRRNLALVMTTWYGIVLAFLFWLALLVVFAWINTTLTGGPPSWVYFVLVGVSSLSAYFLALWFPLVVLRSEGKEILREKQVER